MCSHKIFAEFLTCFNIFQKKLLGIHLKGHVHSVLYLLKKSGLVGGHAFIKCKNSKNKFYCLLYADICIQFICLFSNYPFVIASVPSGGATSDDFGRFLVKKVIKHIARSLFLRTSKNVCSKFIMLNLVLRSCFYISPKVRSNTRPKSPLQKGRLRIPIGK